MLQTQRLILRPPHLDDASHLVELNSTPEVMKFTGDFATLTLSEAQKVLRDRIIPQYEQYKMGRFSVFLKNSNFIGWCGLSFTPEDKEVDLGYRFMQKYWSQGYATEASLACLEYGFRTLGLNKIIAKVMPENLSSIKVAQKLKMEFRRVIKEGPHTFIIYEITSEDYLK